MKYEIPAIRPVFVVGGDPLVTKMFKEQKGFKVVANVKNADIVCFTGGEDVCPAFYNQRILPCSGYNIDRDHEERTLWKKLGKEQYKVGICRGAQFLCVMNGSPLYQDVNSHALKGTHEANFQRKNPDLHVSVPVTSTHHQQMNANIHNEYQVKLLGYTFRSTKKTDDTGTYIGNPMFDQECLYFPHTRTMCFQPHPEYSHEPTKDIFFDLLDDCYTQYHPWVKEDKDIQKEIDMAAAYGAM